MEAKILGIWWTWSWFHRELQTYWKILAEVLGGTVSCSRAVVENGWLPVDLQVGQTGKTVRPT